MKDVFVLLTINLAFPFLLFAQLEIDYDSMSIKKNNTLEFKVGEFIDVCINNYDPDKDDKFTVEITGEQYENTSGINAFSTVVKSRQISAPNNKYCLLSLQVPDRDKSVIKITRYDTTGKIKKEERTYFFRNKGGLKFDVSSGIFVTTLRDNAYVIKNDDDPAKRVVLAENNGKITLGIGLLAHLQFRSQNWINLGFSGGFEVNNDTKIGFLSGVSLFLGHDRKFVITGGAAFRKVKSLSSLYQVGEKIPADVTIVPTVEIWKGGWFGAFTYNF